MVIYRKGCSLMRRWRCAFIVISTLSLSTILWALNMDVFWDDNYLRSPRPARVYASVRNSHSGRKAAASSGVPKIIHQTWRTTELPNAVVPWESSWLALHPTWEYWFWTYTDIRKFVKARFPSFLALYDSYPSDNHRVDMFKYMVMLEYGGVFADIDMECIRPLDDIIDKQDCLLSQEPVEHAYFLHGVDPPLLSNALMSCRRGHPFFRYVLARLESHIGWIKWKNSFESTGSAMLTRMQKLYAARGDFMQKFRIESPTVTISDPRYFHPVVDARVKQVMAAKCHQAQTSEYFLKQMTKEGLDICVHLLANRKPRKNGISMMPFSIHHWEHRLTAYDPDPGATGRRRVRFFTFTATTGEERRATG